MIFYRYAYDLTFCKGSFHLECSSRENLTCVHKNQWFYFHLIRLGSFEQIRFRRLCRNFPGFVAEAVHQNKPVQGRINESDLLSQGPAVGGRDHPDGNAEDGFEVGLVEVVDDVGGSEDGESSTRRRRNRAWGSGQPSLERVTVGLRLADWQPIRSNQS